MRSYLVKFRWKNFEYEEVVTCSTETAARNMIRNKYPGCVIKSAHVQY